MCKDHDPDEPDEEPGEDGDATADDEFDDELFEELVRELFGPGPLFDPDLDADENAPPSPGERVLYALGQLHRLDRLGRLPVHPSAFEVADVARVLGVATYAG